MGKADQGKDLDFTGIFAATTRAPEAPSLPRKVPEEIIIGAKALKKGGYFVNITNPRARRIARPDAATVLIVEDDPSTLLLIDHVLAKAAYRTRKAAANQGRRPSSGGKGGARRLSAARPVTRAGFRCP